MALAASFAYTVHLVFAALLTGSVLFGAWVIPSVAGSLSGGAVEVLATRLRWISRASALVLFLTGGYMLSAFGYVPGDRLLGSVEGYLVLAMIVLWLVLIGIVEMAGARLTTGRDATSLLYAAAVVAVVVLLDAGALAGMGG